MNVDKYRPRGTTWKQRDQGPDMGKCRHWASRKVPTPTVSGVTRGVSQGGVLKGAR